MVIIPRLSKQIKISKFYNLQNTHKYTLFFLCYELSTNQLIYFKQNNIAFCLLRKQLFKKNFQFNGKNTILSVFLTDVNKLTSLLMHTNKSKKIHPIFLLSQNKLISIIKLTKLIKNKKPLSVQIQQPLTRIVTILKKISTSSNG